MRTWKSFLDNESYLNAVRIPRIRCEYKRWARGTCRAVRLCSFAVSVVTAIPSCVRSCPQAKQTWPAAAMWCVKSKLEILRYYAYGSSCSYSFKGKMDDSRETLWSLAMVKDILPALTNSKILCIVNKDFLVSSDWVHICPSASARTDASRLTVFFT